MNPDDKICYCYGVSYRKLFNYARRHGLIKPSQMADCLGAGTGCGWCIPILKKIFESAGRGPAAIRTGSHPGAVRRSPPQVHREQRAEESLRVKRTFVAVTAKLWAFTLLLLSTESRKHESTKRGWTEVVRLRPLLPLIFSCQQDS